MPSERHPQIHVPKPLLETIAFEIADAAIDAELAYRARKIEGTSRGPALNDCASFAKEG